jgi:hypothetical protein
MARPSHAPLFTAFQASIDDCILPHLRYAKRLRRCCARTELALAILALLQPRRAAAVLDGDITPPSFLTLILCAVLYSVALYIYSLSIVAVLKRRGSQPTLSQEPRKHSVARARICGNAVNAPFLTLLMCAMLLPVSL